MEDEDSGTADAPVRAAGADPAPSSGGDMLWERSVPGVQDVPLLQTLRAGWRDMRSLQKVTGLRRWSPSVSAALCLLVVGLVLGAGPTKKPQAGKSPPGPTVTVTVTVTPTPTPTVTVTATATAPAPPEPSATLSGPSKRYMDLARQAVDALRTLRSATKSGISYVNYNPAVAQAQAAVDRFYDDTRSDTEFVMVINSKLSIAMQYYRDAGQIWERKFKISFGSTDDYVTSNDIYSGSWLRTHPEVMQMVKISGGYNGLLGYSIIACVSACWSMGDGAVEEAATALRTEEEKQRR